MNRSRLARSTPIRRVSRKRAKAAPERRKMVEAILRSRPWCEVRWDDRCAGRSVEVHEPRTRARYPGIETITNPDNTTSSCSYCHRMLTEHPAEAERRLDVHGRPLMVPSSPRPLPYGGMN